MGKRDGNKFERVDKDYYSTIDPSCMVPAFVDRVRGLKYAEPCYGEGHLEDLLMDVATCVWRSDIRPTVGSSLVKDATKLNIDDLQEADVCISNPPYQWSMLKPLLDHLPTQKPTWLLLPADYMHNIRMGSYMERCSTVIAVGRMYWFESVWKEVQLLTDDLDRFKIEDWFWERSVVYGDGTIRYVGWFCPKRNIPTEKEAVKGVSNMCWYKFNKWHLGATEFIGRS